ncbi:MAG: hypothetical protein ABI091_26020 [Ferruginibacter sp.]
MKRVDLKSAFKQNRIKLFIILILVGFISAFGQEGRNTKVDDKSVDSLEKKDPIPLINKSEDWRVNIETQKQIIKSLKQQLNSVIDSFKGTAAERKVITKYIKVYKVVPIFLPQNYSLAYDSSFFKKDTLAEIYYAPPKVSLLKKIFTKQHKH